MSASEPTRLGLVLGGGGARGLAHLGVLEVLEAEGIRPAIIAGSSMGGLIGALWASGLSARKITDLARGFRFPRWFVPGAVADWATVFRPAASVLAPLSFEGLPIPLRLTAVDLEQGVPVILDTGPLMPAVRATCAVPGVMPPEKIGGRWLIDGGVVSMLPVDSAWSANPNVVVAVSVNARLARRMPGLNWKLTGMLSRLGRRLPNLATAGVSLAILARAAEITLARSTVLSSAMAAPELLVDVDLGNIGLRDFGRLSEAMARGRAAAARALPSLRTLLAAPRQALGEGAATEASERLDPVCLMTMVQGRARARTLFRGRTYLFCSENCRDAFLQAPEGYLAHVAGPRFSTA